jgi:four helix bundle protein
LEQQIKRASISIAANIAEGTSRTSYKDQAHFSQIAYGSLMETACLSTLAEDLGYFTTANQSHLREQVQCLANKLNALRKYQPFPQLIDYFIQGRFRTIEPTIKNLLSVKHY